MNKWKQVVANTNLIQTETERSFLIKLPKSDFMFWHPAKLVQISGKNSYRLSISYTDSFEFNIFKQNSSYKKIDERKITADEFEKYFA